MKTAPNLAQCLAECLPGYSLPQALYTDEAIYRQDLENLFFREWIFVAHDCEIGNNCIIANSVQIAGHVTIQDWVIIGGGSLVHQFGIIGQHSMIQGGLQVANDIPPFVLAASIPMKYSGLNVVGLRRRGFSNEDIQVIKDAYKTLYHSGLNLSEAKIELKNKFNNTYVDTILEFLNSTKRSLLKR